MAFRPSLNESVLERRVVLNAAGVSAMAQAASRQNAIVQRLIFNALRDQFRSAGNNLRSAINTQVGELFANGTPTAQLRGDFNSRVAGQVFASAFQLSSQAALLPGSSRLVSRLQSSLLGSNPRSLLTRLENLPQAAMANASPARIQAAIARTLNSVFSAGRSQLNNFLSSTPINRLSVDQAGNRIPLQQFMGSQLISQLGNTLGSLSQSFPKFASSALFANGALTATPANQLAFINQAGSALGTAAFQLGSDIALFPFNSTVVTPALRSGLFGNSPTSLFTQLQNLPNAAATFGTAASTAFNTGFQNLVFPLNSFFNLPTTAQNLTLPTSQLNSIIGPAFDSISNGFNNGFGNGFIGFGTAPTTFNTNFGTGFTGFVTSFNTSNGFNVPTVNTLPTGVPGTGQPGTGTGQPGTGTGTGQPGTTGSTTG